MLLEQWVVAQSAKSMAVMFEQVAVGGFPNHCAMVLSARCGMAAVHRMRARLRWMLFVRPQFTLQPIWGRISLTMPAIQSLHPPP